MESRIDDGYDEFHWSHDTSANWGTFNEYYGWLEEKYGETYKVENHPKSKWVQNGMPVEKHQTYWCIEKAVDFIKGNCNKPWFFSINMYDPHHPFDPPRELLDRYLDKLDEIPLPSYFDHEEKTKSVWQEMDHYGAYNHHAGFPYDELDDLDHKMVRAAYWAMCDMIDLQVGRLIDVLISTGQYEDTIIIFHSDHGEMLGDHGIYLKGPYFYDCAVKVPLIISWPGHVRGGRRAALVELMDLPETVLDLCGLPVYEGMQGRSLVPVLENPDIPFRDDVYSEYLNAMPWHRDPVPFLSMVRTKEWKLVLSHSGNGDGELYDLTRDPGESRNLYHEDDFKDIRGQMTRRLLERWARMTDPLPVRKADW